MNHFAIYLKLTEHCKLNCILTGLIFLVCGLGTKVKFLPVIFSFHSEVLILLRLKN